VKASAPEVTVDYFTVLHLPRRPWLSADEVRGAFLSLSAPIHPDRVHNDGTEAKTAAQARFAALNAAWACLRDPKERLGHLLELELGAKPAPLQRLSSDGSDTYFKLARFCRVADEFLRQQAATASPLLRVRAFRHALVLREQLEALQTTLTHRHAELEKEVQGLNIAWENAPASGPDRTEALPLDRLEQLYRELAYVQRWTEQIRTKLGQLILSP
jgi:curved DNA-binding protein CbpA